MVSIHEVVDIIDCPPVSDLQGWLEEAANPSTVHETAFTVETHIVLHSKQLLIMSLKSLRCLSLSSTITRKAVVDHEFEAV